MAIVMPTDGPIATPIATQKGIFPVTAPTMAPTVTPKETPRASHRLMDLFFYSFSLILMVTYHSGHSHASFPSLRSWHRQYH